MDTPEPTTPVPDRPDGEPHQHQPPDRPFHSKRRHKKSRKGCINCKNRKVKCDETFPTCRSCYLRKTTCVYPSSSSASSEAQASQDVLQPPVGQTLAADSIALPFDAATATFPPSSSSSYFSSAPSTSPPLALFAFDHPASSSSSEDIFSSYNPVEIPWTTAPLYNSPGLLPPSPNFDSVDLKIFWHYMIKASTSFTVDSSYQGPIEETLRSTVVSYAFNAPFLMDNIFALSSLDLQNFEPGFARSRALFYHARAIEGYRQAVENASPETFPAIMANSLFLTVLSSQNFRDPNCKELYIIDWMNVWKGMTAIIELVGMDAVLESGLGIIFFRPTIDLEAAALAIPNHLFFMVSSIGASEPDHLHVAAYITTLKLLGGLYLSLNSGGFSPDVSLRITTWFTFIPRAFIELCELRRPRALIILAHYAAFIKLVMEVWWVKGISERSITDIANNVSAEWQHLLRVPLAVNQVTDRLAVARAILEDPAWMIPVRPKADVDKEFAVLRGEDPQSDAFHHMQREQQQDLDTDRLVDEAVNTKIAETMTWDGSGLQ